MSPTLDATKDMTEADKAAYWFDLYLEETTKRRQLERELEMHKTLIREHNDGCDEACIARASHCEPFTSRGRDCPDCPKDWKV